MCSRINNTGPPSLPIIINPLIASKKRNPPQINGAGKQIQKKFCMDFSSTSKWKWYRFALLFATAEYVVAKNQSANIPHHIRRTIFGRKNWRESYKFPKYISGKTGWCSLGSER
jgi:hypothetical protein